MFHASRVKLYVSSRFSPPTCQKSPLGSLVLLTQCAPCWMSGAGAEVANSCSTGRGTVLRNRVGPRPTAFPVPTSIRPSTSSRLPSIIHCQGSRPAPALHYKLPYSLCSCLVCTTRACLTLIKAWSYLHSGLRLVPFSLPENPGVRPWTSVHSMNYSTPPTGYVSWKQI